MWLERAIKFGFTKRSILLLIGMSLFASTTEIFGVGIFLPIFQFIRMKGDVDALQVESSIWGYLIDGFGWIGMPVSLVALLLLSFSFFLGRQIFTYLRLVYHSVVSQRLIQTIRLRMFDRYLDSSTSFHDSLPIGNLLNAMTTEVNQAVLGIMAPMELVAYLIMALGYLLILSVLSWEMTLASFFVLLLASQVPKVWILMSAHTGRRLADANTVMSSFLVDRLKSPRLVRLAGTEMAEKEEFAGLTRSQRKHAVFGSILLARTEVSIEPIVIGLSLAFLYFAYAVLQMQIEMIGLYLVVVFRLMPLVKGILSQWQAVQRFSGAIEVIEDRLQSMERSKELDAGTRSLGLFHSLCFRDVSYRYPAVESNTLDGVSLEIEFGRMTALVGPSGSGKSTLIDLLPRLRLPQSGLISVDQHPIDEYTLKSLRQAIAYAPQSPQIFDGSVSHHICYGKQDTTKGEIREAARLAGANRFIEQLPNGYDTLLGEDAVKLSGGQRQRLDLARALVRQAPILILDEPTSNLDAESEEAFLQALRRIREETKTTIIIVAHRLASIVDADQIVVLNQGKVESIGEHTQLLRTSEWYSQAWVTQSDTKV